MNDAPKFDYEVEMTKTNGETEIHTVGHAESPEAAAARMMELYGYPTHYRLWAAVSIKVIRTLKAYAPADVQIGELSASWDDHGRYVLTDSQGREAYSEHGGGHVRSALEFLLQARPQAQWKTVGLLTTLRQAFREDSVNGHDWSIGKLIERGPTKRAVEIYLSGARDRDERHHGQNTF